MTRVGEIPGVAVSGRAPGALLAVEGGDALCGQPELVGDLYRRGVLERMEALDEGQRTKTFCVKSRKKFLDRAVGIR